jgi:uncharacterized protein involved in exopolysaccharide biosynthesis
MIDTKARNNEGSKPQKLKIIALGFCLAVFLAVVSAFLVEFWANNREKVTGNFPRRNG